ncbi:MAG: HPP family protein [Flavobacteriaceae bacterium]
MKKWLAILLPEPVAGGAGPAIRAALGAILGLALTASISGAVTEAPGALLLMAPMGASAVLLFAVPASPLAQPWSILGGNILAAIFGVAAARYIANPLLAAPLAVGLAIAVGSMLRCLHPPSGAVALTAVLGGAEVRASGFDFVVVPVLLNSLLLTFAALVFNNLTGRSYPHRAHAPQHPHPLGREIILKDEDFQEVLDDYGERLDIHPQDLRKLYEELRGRAEARRAATARARGIWRRQRLRRK